MPKLALTALTACAALVLTGCVAAPDVTPTPTNELLAELPDWAGGSFEKGFTDYVLVSAGVTELGEKLVYSAQTDEGEQCIIALAPPPRDDADSDAFSLAVCSPAEQFAEDGIVGGFGSINSASVHLMPPDYTKPLKPGWTRVNAELAIKF
ncbi:hypothetical protein [Salinibacterium sp. NK8237]|uniref:hypothetical protein n=1 Tax=Salinibacterium sp. NK8237 TaxID=2792038 RepID=UPI0018CE5E6F|nr:hypothetical protein [Salinibacterium sp. NK8237]MBH0130899.1 hypothetical protein [Salinibacterium sp. NK8237]